MTIVYIPSPRELHSLSSPVLSVTNCVFSCHFETDMTQSNSDLVTDDQFPILEYNLSRDPYLLLSGQNPFKLKTVEQLSLEVSRHPGHCWPDWTRHTRQSRRASTSTLVIIIRQIPTSLSTLLLLSHQPHAEDILKIKIFPLYLEGSPIHPWPDTDTIWTAC